MTDSRPWDGCNHSTNASFPIDQGKAMQHSSEGSQLSPSTGSCLGRHCAEQVSWNSSYALYQWWACIMIITACTDCLNAAKNDHPADHCEFGQHGWQNEDVNVITAIQNFTRLVMDGKDGRETDIPLRFLVHFIGDSHQPLHLSGRDKGGNGGVLCMKRSVLRHVSWMVW